MNTNFISTFQTALKRLALISTIAVLAACAGNNTSSNRAVPDGYHKVRPGDTLTQIAKRYGQNVNTLVAWNNLPNASQIEVGQVLRVRRHVASLSTATQQRQTTAVTPINRLNLQWPTDNASSSIIQRYNGTTSKGIDIAGTQGQQIRSASRERSRPCRMGKIGRTLCRKTSIRERINYDSVLRYYPYF